MHSFPHHLWGRMQGAISNGVFSSKSNPIFLDFQLFIGDHQREYCQNFEIFIPK